MSTNKLFINFSLFKIYDKNILYREISLFNLYIITFNEFVDFLCIKFILI